MEKDFKYSGRVYRHKALKEKTLDDIKTIAYSLLNNKEYEIIKAEKEEYFYFDGYEQNGKILDNRFRYKYKGILKAHNEHYHGFYANSEIGIYCRLIEKLLGNEEPYFPSV